MDRQGVLDKVTQHLLTQKCRSRDDDEGGICMYRGNGMYKGTKCAIGCLIKDELYYPELEGQTIEKPEVRSIVSRSLDTALSFFDVYFLEGLQQIHDKVDIARWREALADFASTNALKFNPPKV